MTTITSRAPSTDDKETTTVVDQPSCSPQSVTGTEPDDIEPGTAVNPPSGSPQPVTGIELAANSRNQTLSSFIETIHHCFHALTLTILHCLEDLVDVLTHISILSSFR